MQSYKINFFFRCVQTSLFEMMYDKYYFNPIKIFVLVLVPIKF